jgi:antitoxin component YwqK of YwqJK toxin-antitoxin module
MKKILILCFVFTSLLWSAAPSTISWHGIITDAEDTYLDGNYNLTTKLFDAYTGGNEIWSETHNNLPINEGLANIILGSVNPFGLDFDEQYWLEITVGDDAPLTRIALNSVPYSLYSKRAGGVFEADSLVLKDSEGDIRFILNPETGTFKMMDNGTVWYELSVNSPPKTTAYNSDGSKVVTESNGNKTFYNESGDILKKEIYENGKHIGTQEYKNGELSHVYISSQDDSEPDVEIKQNTYYNNGEITKTENQKIQNGILIEKTENTSSGEIQETQTINEDGSITKTEKYTKDGKTYESETSYFNGFKIEEKLYDDGTLSKYTVYVQDDTEPNTTKSISEFYENGTVSSAEENVWKNDKLVSSKGYHNGQLSDEIEISYEGDNNEVEVSKYTYYAGGVKKGSSITKEKDGVDIETLIFNKNDIIISKVEKYTEGDNDEVQVEKETKYEDGNVSKIFVTKEISRNEFEFQEYNSDGNLIYTRKRTILGENKYKDESIYYDENGAMLSREVEETENGQTTKFDMYTSTGQYHSEYQNGTLVSESATHTENNPYGEPFSFNNSKTVEYFTDGYMQRTETTEYSDENGDNYLKEQKIVNGSSGYITNHVENQDGSSYSRIVQTPENVTVLAEKNKTVGNTETTKNHEVGRDIYAKGTKCFRITHPEKSFKYLIHAAIESNEVLNKYSGNVTTGSDSLATVSLPSYFENVNTDYRYTLTVISTDFVQAIVYSEIDEENEFIIKTNAPNVKVSWEVTGRRDDDYMQDNPFEAEPYK